MTGPEDELVHPATGPGFGESVTFAWGDAARELYGSARLGLGADGTASTLALLFAGERPVAVAAAGGGGGAAPPRGRGGGGGGAGPAEGPPAAGGEEVAAPSWDRFEVGGVAATIEVPLESWTVSVDGADGGFSLRFEALTAPLGVALAGTDGYEQPCRVTGTVRVGEGRQEVECLGQRGHAWGVSGWEDMELARTLSAWWDDDRHVALATVRPAGARGHEAEEVAAWLVSPGEEDDDAELQLLDEARLSTSYDGAGHQRRAGLELWPKPESSFPVRASGQVVCGTSLELGRLRLDAAFFRWRMGGREGIGRYDVLRRAT